MRTLVTGSIVALTVLAAASCSTEEVPPDCCVQMTGLVEVLSSGTPSETVILEETESGERYALVGEMAVELADRYGEPVTVTGYETDQGFSVEPDLQRFLVVEYAFEESWQY